MKALAPILMMAIVACGGSTAPPPKTCATALCNGVCCADTEICFAAQSGVKSCATVCMLSSLCPNQTTTPCCQPVIVSGNYTGQSVCTGAPTPADEFECTCGTSTDCLADECAPAIAATSGVISGPYVCVPNDNENHHGCSLPPSDCTVSGQYCATDHGGNQFCSTPCTADTDCNNKLVACCNTTCQGTKTCCGLCGE